MNAVPTRLVVHALVREDGTVDGGELYGVAGALGMSDQQVRLCVKRLVAEGRFVQEGRGRRAVLRITGPAGSTGEGAALVPEAGFVRHAYRQDRGLEPWDGVWHLFAFAVPESARAARDALRDTLTGLGAAPVQGGFYATPNAIGPYVRARAAELNVAAGLTCLSSRDLTVGGTGDPVALAARLWPLDEIAGRYEALRALAGGRGPAWRTRCPSRRPSRRPWAPTRCCRRSCCPGRGRAPRPARRRRTRGSGCGRGRRRGDRGCSGCTGRRWARGATRRGRDAAGSRQRSAGDPYGYHPFGAGISLRTVATAQDDGLSPEGSLRG